MPIDWRILLFFLPLTLTAQPFQALTELHLPGWERPLTKGRSFSLLPAEGALHVQIAEGVPPTPIDAAAIEMLAWKDIGLIPEALPASREEAPIFELRHKVHTIDDPSYKDYSSFALYLDPATLDGLSLPLLLLVDCHGPANFGSVQYHSGEIDDVRLSGRYEKAFSLKADGPYLALYLLEALPEEDPLLKLMPLLSNGRKANVHQLRPEQIDALQAWLEATDLIFVEADGKLHRARLKLQSYFDYLRSHD